MITLVKIVCAWLTEELSTDFWTPFIDLASRTSGRAPLSYRWVGGTTAATVCD
jgi:hypothetical protein